MSQTETQSQNQTPAVTRPGPAIALATKLRGFAEALDRAEEALLKLNPNEHAEEMLLAGVREKLAVAHQQVSLAADALGVLPIDWKPSKAKRQTGLAAGDQVLLRAKSAAQYEGIIEASAVMAVVKMTAAGRVLCRVKTDGATVEDILVPRGHLQRAPQAQ